MFFTARCNCLRIVLLGLVATYLLTLLILFLIDDIKISLEFKTNQIVVETKGQAPPSKSNLFTDWILLNNIVYTFTYNIL